MKYTTPAKDGSDPESFNISEVTFLKRYFREEDGWIYAPLELDVLKDEILWMRSSSDTLADYKQLLLGMLQELALHDRETFNTVSNEVREACLLAAVPYPEVDRDQFLARVRRNNAEGRGTNEAYDPESSTDPLSSVDSPARLKPVVL